MRLAWSWRRSAQSSEPPGGGHGLALRERGERQLRGPDAGLGPGAERRHHGQRGDQADQHAGARDQPELADGLVVGRDEDEEAHRRGEGAEHERAAHAARRLGQRLAVRQRAPHQLAVEDHPTDHVVSQREIEDGVEQTGLGVAGQSRGVGIENLPQQEKVSLPRLRQLLPQATTESPPKHAGSVGHRV